jgi:aspartokinase
MSKNMTEKGTGLDKSKAPIVIHKVGGSCLTSAEALKQLLNLLDVYKANRNIFVASAFKNVTDRLIEVETRG